MLCQASEVMIPTEETARQMYFLSKALNHGMPLLMVGPTGTGKTFVTNSYLGLLPKDHYVVNTVSLLARTTVDQTQDMIMCRLDRQV